MPLIAQRPSPTLMQDLLDTCTALQAAGHGAKGAVIDRLCAAYGMGRNAAYQQLERWAGYAPQRKVRCDAGNSKLSGDALAMLAALKAEGVRQNGKSTLTTEVGLNIMDANGIAVPVSASQANRLLRGKRMDKTSQSQARTYQQMRSEHPNYLHQIDPSLCLVYYMGGKQRVIRDDELYKNKLDKLAGLKFKVWRYVRTDHATGVIDVLYIEAKGESQANLFAFLMHTWGKVPGRLSHGVPKYLLWDKGSANMAGGIKKLLEGLQVQQISHAAGKAWVKGSVEKSNDIVERQFESRLRAEPVESVAELNVAAQRWCAAFNANTLAKQDTRLHRMGCEPMVRNDLWATVLHEQLTALPDPALCAWFMSGQQTLRLVDSHYRVSFKHPQAARTAVYDLSPWGHELAAKEQVKITPLLLGGVCEVRIEVARINQATLILNVLPRADYDSFGFPASAPLVGQAFASAQHSAAMSAQKTLRQAAWGTADEAAVDKLRRANARPFVQTHEVVDADTGEVTTVKTGLRAHSHIGQTGAHDQLSKVAYLPKRAKVMDSPALQQAQALSVTHAALAMPTVGLFAAAKALREALGAAYSPATYQWLQSRFGEAVPADQVDGLADAWTEHLAAQDGPAPLKRMAV